MLKHNHVKAALYPNNYSENHFTRAYSLELDCGDPRHVKNKTETSITKLEKKYLDKVFGNSENFNFVSLANVEQIMMSFFGISLSLLLIIETCGWKTSSFREIAPS